jgi:hypothetical protein
MRSKEQIEEFVGRLTSDLPFFLDQLWRTIGLPPLAEHQRQMATWLQRGPTRRGVRAFRGAAKTWVTLGYCIWRLFRNKDDRILLVSKSERHSKDSLYMVRKWIGQVAFLQHMAPDRSGGQRDSALQFDIRQAPSDRTPSFTAASVTGQITGCRSTCIISDDVETNQSSLTLDSRTRLREEVKEYDNILIPGGDIIFLGTPHHEESLYDKLAESGYVFQSWPAQYPAAGSEPSDLAPAIQKALATGVASPGDSIWPERFSIDELIEREASEGRSTYAMQYQMLTHLGDDLRYPLKLSDLIVFPVAKEKAPLTIAWGTRNDHGGSTKMEEIKSLGFAGDAFHAPIMFDKQWSYYTGTYMWIDPSGRGKDKTSYAIVAHLNGYLWVKAVGGWQGGYQREVLEGLAYQAKLHDARTIFVEDNFGQGMFTALFEPVLQSAFVEAGTTDEFPDGWKASLESIRVSGQKEIRLIGGLEPIFNQHRLVLHPDVAANEDLQRQITRITKQRNCLGHDDEVEALAMCCIQWQDVMNLDPDNAADRIRETFIQKQLAAHYASFGQGMRKPGWIRSRSCHLEQRSQG